jgi:hypothetical protein
MLDHQFKKVIANPRSVGCDEPGCGLREDLHPVIDRPRDVMDEREIKSYAASLVTMPQTYHAAFALAEQRALDGPIRNADQRDNPRETEEEIADGINYLVWEVQKLDRREQTDLVQEKKMEAFAAIVKGCEWWHSIQVYKHPND